jgi:hypothetical protein
MSDKTSYSLNNIIINTINKFDCPSTAKLLQTEKQLIQLA